MSKVLVLGDMHLSEDGPTTRHDTLIDTQVTKLYYILEKAKEEKVAAIVQMGDVLDKPRVSNRVMTNFIQWLNDLKTAGIPFVCTLGQHDLVGRNYHKYKKESDMAILEAAGLVTILISGEAWAPIDGDFVVQGYGYKEPETLDFFDGKDQELQLNKIKIAIVHANVGLNEMHFKGHDKTVIAVDSLNIKTVDYAFFGDQHPGFPPYQFKNPRKTIAYSPGTMSRMKSDEEDIPIKFAIVDLESRSIEEIDIPHEPTPFIKDDTKVKKVEDTALAFKARLVKANNRERISERKLVESNGATLGYSRAAIDMVLTYIEGE
jgi:DNA repair exonuclease SbcCD nuclease subunit